MIKWLRQWFEPHPEVTEALAGSAERKAHSEEFRRRIERESAPLVAALVENGFAPAVQATFQRKSHS